MTYDGSRVGNEDVDLIYLYNPVINQGFYPPFQVRPPPCRAPAPSAAARRLSNSCSVGALATIA